MSANTRQEDFLFAEHVLRHGFATEEQVQQCLGLLARMRGELELDETLENILLKKGYLAKAQAQVIRSDINPEASGGAKNQIEGYQLLVRLGSGAMGSVYKAHHQKLNIPVALKVLRVDLAKSKTQIERLKREAQLAARLNHPNIVGSLDVGESNGFHYFAMEYVDGQTVRQVLHRGRLREKEALRIMRDVASALEHAHTHGVIHRDVKPANIILTKGGIVKLADFGLARGKGPSDLTMDQASIGTPQYLAPEQARRGADATPRSDLFSLGASLYHMVTARPPFSGENLGEIFQKVLHCEFDPPEVAVPDLSLDTLYLIHRLMRFHQRERYTSATDLLADLDRMAEGKRIAPPEFKGDYRKYLQRRRWRHGLVAAAAVLVVVVASLFTAQTIQAHRAEGERAAACRLANAVGAGDLEELNTLDDLKRIHTRMLRAALGRCEPDEIADLNRRVQLVQADIVALRGVEACGESAREDGAQFQKLLATAVALRGRIDLDGPRLLAEDIERNIEEASKRTLAVLTRDVKNRGRYKTPEDALKALEQFDGELRNRFLSADEQRTQVIGLANALRVLIREWDRAETDYGPLYEKARSEHRYKAARDNLDLIRDEHEKARSKAQRLGINVNNFLEFFPESDKRDRELRRVEIEHFERLARTADKYLGTMRPDEAERVVLLFRPHAVVTRDRVGYLLGRIDSERKAIVVRQANELTKLSELVRRALEDRQYGRAWNVVSDAERPDHWLPTKQTELTRLHKQADMYKALLDRFIRNAAPQYRPVAGGDLDLFVAADGSTVTLKELKREDLLAIMGFQEPADTRLRGYFHLVESYATHNPEDEAFSIAAAISDLSRADDPRVVALRSREATVKERNRLREIQAEEEHKLIDKADKRNDHVTALQYLNNLLVPSRDGLFYTRYARKHRVRLLQIKARLLRLGASELLRLQASLPERNFRFNAESGAAWLKFDFQEWFPDEGTEKPRNELPRLARIHWRGFFKAEHYREKDWPRLLPRAMHQLLWFNKHAVVDKQNGGARFQADVTNRKLWADGRDDKLNWIELPNPFSVDRDWSIEVSVVWDIDERGKLRDWNKPDDEKRRKGVEDFAVPVYFALTAGELQAGLAATPAWSGGAGGKLPAKFDTEPERLGGGVRLFVQEHLTKGIEKRMYQFHNTLKVKPIAPGSDRAHLKTFREGEPYRIRLERRGLTLRCSITTQAVWEKRATTRVPGAFGDGDLVLNMKLSKREWQRGMSIESGRVFRIFSINPSRLLEVVLTGHVSTE